MYCPGKGKLTILDISEATPKSLGETELPAGARSLTVDNKSHDVFVVYGDKSSAHIAQFKTK